MSEMKHVNKIMRVLVCVLLMWFLLPIDFAQADTWTRRKPITVTNSSGSTLTDYAVRVDVTYDADMQADFDDVRFFASNGYTALDYWLESKTDSTSAIFWVSVPSIPTDGASIYLYYGNGSATSASALGSIFSFADDFSGGTYDEAFTDVTADGGLVALFHFDNDVRDATGRNYWSNVNTTF